MHGLKSAIDRSGRVGTFAAWARARPVCVAERPPAGEWSGIWSAVRLFAGVWIAVSVFGLIMVGNIDWQQMLIDAVREVIPVWPTRF